MPATQPAHQAWEDVHWAEPTSRKNVNGLLVKLPRDGLRRENSKEGAQGLLSRLAHARLLWWLLAKAGRQRERQTLLASAREDEQGHLTARLESATGPVNESQNHEPRGSLCLLYNAEAAPVVCGCGVVVRNPGSTLRLPEFKFSLHHLPTGWS